MYYALFAVHVLISLMLCVVVLLQQSKGGGLAGAFGGAGAGEAMFGARGVTTMLHKATIYLAIAFMVTSLGLVFATARRGGAPGGPTLSSQAARRIPVQPAPIPVEGGPNTENGLIPIAPGEPTGAAGDSTSSAPGDSQQSGTSGAHGDTQPQGAGGGR